MTHVDAKFPQLFIHLTRYCEVYCVAGCCGMDAFSFDRETLKDAITTVGKADAMRACDELLEYVHSVKGYKSGISSAQDDFNHIWKNGDELYAWASNIVIDIRALLC